MVDMQEKATVIHLNRLGFHCSGLAGESIPEWGEEWVRDAGD